jgi:hypothetical protein
MLEKETLWETPFSCKARNPMTTLDKEVGQTKLRFGEIEGSEQYKRAAFGTKDSVTALQLRISCRQQHVGKGDALGNAILV